MFWDFGCVSAVTLGSVGFSRTWTLALFAHVEVVLLDGTMVIWAIMTARGSCVACGAQATPRVDVDVALGQGVHDVPPPLLLQVPGTHDHPVKTSGRFQVFVKGLAVRARVPVAADAGVVGHSLLFMAESFTRTAPLVRDLRQCLAPGIVTCATWLVLHLRDRIVTPLPPRLRHLCRTRMLLSGVVSRRRSVLNAAA